MEYVWSIFEGRTDLKENPLLSALKTECLKAERRGVGRVKSHTTKGIHVGIDGGVRSVYKLVQLLLLVI